MPQGGTRQLLPRTLRGTLLLLLGAALVPVLLVQVGIYFKHFREQRAQEVQANLEVARSVGATFETYAADVLRQELVLGLAFASVHPPPPDETARLLDASVQDYPSLHDLAWVSPSGEILASTLPAAVGMGLGDRPYFLQVQGGAEWAISELLAPAFSESPVFVIARGIRDPGGALQGVMTALVDPARLASVLGIERARGGAISLLDSQGFPVFRFPPVPITRAQREKTAQMPLVARAVAGHEATGTLTPACCAEPRIVAATPIASLGWIAWADRPVAEVMAPLVRGLVLDSALVLAVAVLAFLTAAKLGGRLARSIGLLRDEAAAIGLGQLDRTVSVDRPTELAELAGAFNHMAGELRLRQAEIEGLLGAERTARTAAEEARSQVDAILASITDGFFALDPEARLSYVNPEGERLLRRRGEDLLGLNVWEEFPEARQTRFRTSYQHVMETQESQVVEDYYPPFGQWFEARTYPSKGGVSVFFQDVTERHRVQDELRRAVEAAETANRAKSQFLANMSHEIRTPMNAVIGLTDLVLGTPLAREQRQYLGVVRNSADSLLQIVNDILDFAKIEAGRLEFAAESFAPRELVERTAQALALRAHEKGLELACQVAPDVPAAVVGDAHRVRQVLTNLIGNAVKFTDQGEILVRVRRLEDRGGDGCRLRFSVKDTGIGIPSEKMGVLFQAFTQVDESATRRHGGTGLGLAISKEIVEGMGGSIRVWTREGQGSVFSFTAAFGLPPAAPQAGPPAPLRFPGVRALVVDDSETSRLILRENLESFGVEVDACGSGAEGLALAEAAAERPYRLALLDSRLGEEDGFRLAEQWSRTGGTDPIMLIESNNVRQDATRCRELGIPACLIKPVRLEELADAVRGALSGTPTLPLAGTREEPAAHLATPLPAPYPLRILVAEDNEPNRILVTALLEKRGWQAHPVANGKAAVAAARNGGFDLVLMDVQMPGMDGFAATEAIRKAEQEAGRPPTPVVGVTAHALRGDREKCLAAGMDDYLVKPVVAADLYQVIQRWAPPPQPAPQSGDGPTDLPGVLKAIGGDPKLLERLVESFLRDYPARLEQMRAALGAGDTRALAREAHGLRGAIALFRATEASEEAAHMEALGMDNRLEEAKGALGRLEEKTRRLADFLAGSVGAKG